MIQILKDMGITEYEPRVINQMLEFTYRYVTTIIEDAKIYATHAKKNIVDADDIRLAIQCRMDQSFTSPPPRDFLLDVARQKNQTPLPLIKPYTGPRLPPDRYCLTAPNYRLKSIQKKVSSSAGRITVPRLSIGAVSSRPSTPTLGTPSVQSVTTKVGTPVSLSGQRFSVQIPSSQTAASKSYIRTAITHHELAESFFFFHNSDEAEDIQAQTPLICVKRRWRKRGRRAGCLLRRRSNKPPLPSILLANVQSLDNKIDELRGRLNYQENIKNCNILCFTESWLNDVNINIQLAGYTMYRQDRTAGSGKTSGDGLCIFVNNSWCTISKEVSSYCSPEVEYIMISCRPHYLPREFSSVFFVALYIPLQSEVGTKIALNELYFTAAPSSPHSLCGWTISVCP
ncbi:transcription initiation factor TFIID subunit 9 isoform X2 [Salmo salar]|nr:transcription initiation factor TFIID subunit 9 isoform X2 [Salmo salar]